jgi:uncharacterized protein YjiS (DUF1127 family)
MTMLSNIPGYPPAAPRHTSGPETTSTPGKLLSARVKRLIDRLAAAAIARYERHASIVALRQLSDRELKDIGIWRYQIGEALDEAAKARARAQGFDC